MASRIRATIGAFRSPNMRAKKLAHLGTRMHTQTPLYRSLATVNATIKNFKKIKMPKC